jgi:nicotinate-nucleotide pyrophosphorylase (carboxylating)
VRELSKESIRQAVAAALAEDVGSGDATTLATVPEDALAQGRMAAREPMIACGLAFAAEAFSQLDARVEFRACLADGARLERGSALAEIRGPARAVLTGERVALNFVQRLSGVATAARAFVDAVAGTHAEILDTRKTTPGWRAFEKYAVACGGGANHRFGLHDLVLIKDNHLAALREAQPNAIAAAVRRARERFPDLKVEVEADELAQVEQALAAGADIILLDNMTLAQLAEAVRMTRGRSKLEASGGVNLQTVRGIAETGVDYISVGAITHSARAVDIGLDFE